MFIVYIILVLPPSTTKLKPSQAGTESLNIVIVLFNQRCFVLLFMVNIQMSQWRHIKDKGYYSSRFQMLFIARISNVQLLITTHCTRGEWTIQMSQSLLKELFFSQRKALFVQGTIYKSIVFFYITMK